MSDLVCETNSGLIWALLGILHDILRVTRLGRTTGQLALTFSPQPQSRGTGVGPSPTLKTWSHLSAVPRCWAARPRSSPTLVASCPSLKYLPRQPDEEAAKEVSALTARATSARIVRA